MGQAAAWGYNPGDRLERARRVSFTMRSGAPGGLRGPQGAPGNPRTSRKIMWLAISICGMDAAVLEHLDDDDDDDDFLRLCASKLSLRYLNTAMNNRPFIVDVPLFSHRTFIYKRNCQLPCLITGG